MENSLDEHRRYCILRRINEEGSRLVSRVYRNMRAEYILFLVLQGKLC